MLSLRAKQRFVKRSRQIEPLFKILLIIGLYAFSLGYAQASHVERYVHHTHYVAKAKIKSKTKAAIIKSQYHPKKRQTPLPAHKRGSTTHIAAIYPLHQLYTLNYFPTRYHFSLLPFVANVQTIYCFVTHYHGSKPIYSLRAPPFLA